MNSVYICFTYYQVYITVVKCLINNKKNDIIIADTIPEAHNLIANLEKSCIFNKISYYPEKVILEDFKKNKIEYKLFRSKQLINVFEKSYFFENKYNDIYIYNDWTMFGCYLMDKKIKYHLIEDGMDGFYYLNKYITFFDKYFNPNLFEKFKWFLKKSIHYGYQYFGTSKFAIDIEVNNKDIINISLDKIKEVPRKDLFLKLSATDKKKIYFIFSDEIIIRGNKNFLLLTQPLYVDNLVNSEKIQEKIYKDIIKEYCTNQKIYIKPHPRDNMNYKKILSDYDVNIINKNMPIEVLNYNNDVKFSFGVTISSSSIRNLECIKEKKELGLEFLKKYNEKRRKK